MRGRILKMPLLALCASVLFSCERYLDTNPDGPARAVLANALVCSTDSLHSVSVSVSRKSAVDFRHPVTKLKVYVNDELADERTESDFSSKDHSIDFKAKIRPGDRLDIEFEMDTLTASSGIVVPDEPEFSLVESVPVQRMNSNGRIMDFVRVKAAVKDVRNEDNHYMLLAFRDIEWRVVSVDDPYGVGAVSIGDCIKRERRFLSTDNSLDPLLNRGIAISKDNILVNDTYNLFSDETFRDGSYVVTLLVSDPFSGHVGPMDESKGYNTPSGYVYVKVSAEPVVRPVLRLYSISNTAYNYYTFFAMESTSFGEFTIFDYATYPSNVENGLGFVAAAGTADIVLSK